MMKYPRLAQLLKDKQAELNSIRRVAKVCGISAASYYNYTETDTEPDMSTWQSISKGLGVTVEYLRGETNINDFVVSERKTPYSPTRLLIEQELDQENEEELKEYLYMILDRKRKIRVEN